MAIMSEHPIKTRRASGPILLISQYPEDGYFLREVLTNFACPLEITESWQKAKLVIHCHVLSVVVTERELPDGTWRDVLSSLGTCCNRASASAEMRYTLRNASDSRVDGWFRGRGPA